MRASGSFFTVFAASASIVDGLVIPHAGMTARQLEGSFTKREIDARSPEPIAPQVAGAAGAVLASGFDAATDLIDKLRSDNIEVTPDASKTVAKRDITRRIPEPITPQVAGAAGAVLASGFDAATDLIDKLRSDDTEVTPDATKIVAKRDITRRVAEPITPQAAGAAGAVLASAYDAATDLIDKFRSDDPQATPGASKTVSKREVDARSPVSINPQAIKAVGSVLVSGAGVASTIVGKLTGNDSKGPAASAVPAAKRNTGEQSPEAVVEAVASDNSDALDLARRAPKVNPVFSIPTSPKNATRFSPRGEDGTLINFDEEEEAAAGTVPEADTTLITRAVGSLLRRFTDAVGLSVRTAKQTSDGGFVAIDTANGAAPGSGAGASSNGAGKVTFA